MLQPKLRFPEFEGDWKRKSFKEIYSFRSTNSFSRDKLNYERGIIKNIHYGDIHSKFNSLFDVKKEHVPFINEEISIDRISVENYLKVKDLIIADASEDYDDIGKCIEIINLSDEKVLAGLHTFVARPDLFEMSLGFGNYLMKSEKIKLQIKTIAQGTKVLSLSATRLSDVQLDLPSFQEQTKIANFLSSIDEKINLLKEKKALLEEYKKGMMQKIFNQEIRFKDVNGNDFEDWQAKNLGEIGEFKNGINKDKSDFGFGFPFVNLMDVFGKSTVSDLQLGLVNADEKDILNYNLKKGDVLFIRSSVKKTGVGETSVILKDLKNTVYSGFLIRFRDSKIKLDLHFKKYCFSNKLFRENLISKSTTSANTNINQEALNDLCIKIPAISEQTKIANFLSAIDEKIALVETQIEDTHEYKKGLLQQMFV